VARNCIDVIKALPQRTPSLLLITQKQVTQEDA
jgi:hypothetical protein